jgi:hypothetical protein
MPRSQGEAAVEVGNGASCEIARTAISRHELLNPSYLRIAHLGLGFRARKVAAAVLRRVSQSGGCAVGRVVRASEAAQSE